MQRKAEMQDYLVRVHGTGAGGFRTSSRSFTLVEMLVVVSIITILASLLLPQLQSALAQARNAICVNNQKQIASAWHIYGSNNNGYLVPLRVNNAIPALTDHWPNYLLEILDLKTNPSSHLRFETNRSVFFCPELPNNDTLIYCCSYGMNSFAIGGNSAYGNPGYSRFSQIKRSSGQLFIADSRWNSTDASNGNYSVGGDPGGILQVSYRHFNTVNVGYADGHVQGRDSDDLTVASWWTSLPWGWP